MLRTARRANAAKPNSGHDGCRILKLMYANTSEICQGLQGYLRADSIDMQVENYEGLEPAIRRVLEGFKRIMECVRST